MNGNNYLGRTSLFAAALAFAAVMVAARETQAPLPISETVRLAPPPASERRFWGRESFIPDWDRAEQIDALASDHFLQHYWPRFAPAAGYGKSAENQIGRIPGDGLIRVYQTPYWRAAEPAATRDGAETINRRLRVIAARGESEPIAIAVQSGTSGVEIMVTTDKFSGESAVLAAEAVSVRLMLAYSAREQPGHKPSPERVQPMVLLKPPDDRWRFPANHTLAYVIDFHVPADFPAGVYSGAVEIHADGARLHRIPIDLEVVSFTLKTNNFHAGAFGTTYDIWDGGFTGYTQEMMEMDSRYGFNLAGGFFNKGYEVPFRRLDENTVDIDTNDSRFEKFDRTMHQLRQFGMGDVAFWNWGASGNVNQFNRVLQKAGYPGIETRAGKRGFAAICKALKLAEARYGWPEFVLNPFDEALKDQDAARELIAAAPLVRAASPDTRLYITEWRRGYTRHYQSSGRQLRGKRRPREEEMAKLVASGEAPRLNFAVVGANTLDRDARQLQNRLGGEFWHYGGANRVNLQARLAYGFLPWIVRAESALVWANYKGKLDGYGWTVHFAMPLDPDGRKNKDTQGPVIASAYAIAIREGIDDRKYIETLRYHATRLRSEPDLRYLTALQSKIARTVVNLRDIGGLENSDAAVTEEFAFERYRHEIRRRILALLDTRGQ